MANSADGTNQWAESEVLNLIIVSGVRILFKPNLLKLLEKPSSEAAIFTSVNGVCDGHNEHAGSFRE